MRHPNAFEVIVVGGGHAGTEAALAAARSGARTLLLTHNLETIGQMSCNPAIGGIGKSHLVREIDALGGLMAQAADRSGIQFRILNSRKGAAVRATRCQIDRTLYKQAVQQRLYGQPNLQLFQQAVDDLLLEGQRVIGIRTQMGLEFRARCVVLTAGTFLGGFIHIGLANYPGGRAGEAPASVLAQRLRDLPLRVDRLKTGTPPRLDARTIDFSRLEVQVGDVPVPVLSYLGRAAEHPRQVPCHITHTNARTHEIIAAALDRSPLFTGLIQGRGPRYCPSIEDKIVRFADKATHQIFVEPEGLSSAEVYPNGISTSLPFDAQLELVRSIAGFERAELTRAGYAIEYDYFDPRDLKPSMETKALEGLFFAGQINGTTGYEEAAAQGLVAGLNAARKAHGAPPWWPRRDEAYIGVLIDDLITRGTNEPYRMFTSRAEHRLLLREDNADLRLTPIGRTLGLVDDGRWQAFNEKREAIEREQARLESTWLHRGQSTEASVAHLLGQPLKRDCALIELLRRPDVTYAGLMSLPGVGPGVSDPQVAEQLEIAAKYHGYIRRQQAEIARHAAYETMPLPQDMDYAHIPGLSTEVRQTLLQHRPLTLGQASRIPGITPAAISLLLIHLKRRSSSTVQFPATGKRAVRPGNRTSPPDPAHTLAEGLAQLALPLPPVTFQALLRYVALLEVWNRAYNLTAVRHPNDMVRRHLLDCLTILPYVRGSQVLDVGCGAGLPGVVIALTRPDLHCVLLDKNAKKTRFCLQVVAELGIPNVQVVRGRIEEYPADGSFHTVVARAFGPLSALRSLTRGALAPGGCLLAMKGADAHREVASLPASDRHAAVIPLTVPGLGVPRHLIMVDTGAALTENSA